MTEVLQRVDTGQSILTDSSVGMPKKVYIDPERALSFQTNSDKLDKLSALKTNTTLADVTEELDALKLDEGENTNADPNKEQTPTGEESTKQPDMPPGVLMGGMGGFYPPGYQMGAYGGMPPPGLPCFAPAGFAPPGLLVQDMKIPTMGYEYQWFNSANAYSMTAGYSRTNPEPDRQRTPRRVRQEFKADEATEEQWSHRERKRDDPVKALKATPVYQDNQDVQGDDRPKTPDPAKRLTKRRWENEIAQWRNDWREIDGVRKLEKLSFEKSACKAAWADAKTKGKQAQQPHDQEAQLRDAEKLLRERFANK
jgi:hypothetical protein